MVFNNFVMTVTTTSVQSSTTFSTYFIPVKFVYSILIIHAFATNPDNNAMHFVTVNVVRNEI